MKNQNVLRILALVFAIAMMLTVASCDMLDKLLGKPEATTPEVTTEEPTEVTTPEPTTPAHEHTEEVVPGKAATCTETGLTDGKKCSECGEELVAQEVIPVVAHTEEVVAGKAATCTEAGLTEGKKCSVCGEVLVAQEEIAMLDHTYGTNVTVVTPATCTVAGKGTVACECGATKEVEIKALGHTKVAIPAVAPTCVANGLTAGEKCSVCNEVLKAQETVAMTPDVHSYQRDLINNEQRFNATWGICLDCGYVHAKHEHIVENGVCKYCEVAPFELEVVSIFDYNKDEKNDTFTMSNMLPEKFRAEGVAHVNAKVDSITTAPHSEYDEIKANSGNKIPYPHFYVSDGDKANSYLLYNVTVAEAGTYDLAIHYRLKDARYREARITINGEIALDFSYGWSESSSAVLDETTSKLLSNDYLIGTYVYGFQVKLKAGVNEIKISAPGQTAKTQHFRDLFFALATCDSHSYQDDITNNEQRFNATWGICTDCGYIDAKHEHIVENGKCKYCGVAPYTMEVTSIFDFNKDEKNDVFTMANMLPEKFRAEGVAHVNAKADSITTAPHSEYDEITDSNANTNLPYPHFYVSDGDKANSYLLYNVTVEKAGIYDLAIHYRLKDARYREARITINGETALDFSYGWSESSSAALDDTTKKLLSNDVLIGTYVYGFQVELKAGVNEIKISAPGQTAKTQHFRDLFFAFNRCTECVLVNSKCINCGFNCEHNDLDENYVCKNCKKDFGLTVEEAIAIGMTYEKGKYGADYYYVTLTLDDQVNNPGGFARAKIAEGLYVTVNGFLGTAAPEYKLGDTVTFFAKVGAANSTKTTGGKELRLYEVASYEVIKTAEAPAQ